VRAMWLMLQQDVPTEYVIATGQTRSVQDLCRIAFGHVGLDYREHVVRRPHLLRPAEVHTLQGDATLARERLGWVPEITFEDMVREMVDADLARHRARMRD